MNGYKFIRAHPASARKMNFPPINLICENQGMTEKRGMKELDLGATGRRVAERITYYRNARSLTYQALSQAIAGLGWNIPELGLRRIESRARRVTVDDLLAIAAALDVSPLELLLPDRDGEGTSTGVPADVNAAEIWAWAHGATTLNLEARRAYWHTHSITLRDQLEDMKELAEAKGVKARRWAQHHIQVYEQELDVTYARIEELDRIIGQRSDG